MADRVKVKVVNLGSCNGCELEILDALHLDPDLLLCREGDRPDVVLLTGVLTMTNLARAERERIPGDVPLVRVGSCAISQGLFLPPDGALDRVPSLCGKAPAVCGCPPVSNAIAEAVNVAVDKERPCVSA